MSSINFDNVYWLFIAVPLLAVLTVPFAIAIRKDNRNGHNIASICIHIVMAVLIAFAAAGTSIVTVITETDVYVLADVSYSAEKNLDTIDGYISNLKKNLPRNSKLGVVCFGKESEVLTGLGKKVKPVRESNVDDSETNIASALEYTGGLFKEGVIKRIVLITDGKQTYDNGANELKRTVENLKTRDIRVDAIYLNDNISEDAKEVQISSAEFTRTAYLNHSERVQLLIQSSYRANASITLYRNGEEYDKLPVTLSIGANTVGFELDTSVSGEYDYRAVVDAEGDESSLNNTYSFTQVVSGAVNILLVTADASDEEQVKSLYGSEAQITSYNVNKNANVPVSIEELCDYDEIILSDVDLTSLNNYEMFLNSLNTVISSFGKSLLTVGDMCIQLKTEGELKALDDMLPVRYGDSLDNPKLYTIVLDVSRSMQIWSRMILAKQAAARLVGGLNDSDYVCIVAFSGDVKVLQAPSKVGDCREEISEKLSDISFEQGTLVGLGLNKALDEMRKNTDNYSEMQVMLITDGLTYEGYPQEDGKKYDPSVAVQAMRAYGIVTSVLSVGGGNENLEWLDTLAAQGRGKHFHANDEKELELVMFEAVKKETQEPVTENSWITKNKPRDEVLDGVNLDDAYVSKFIISKSKSSATDVLTVGYKYQNVTVDVPFYSYWNYGNGKVSSYTANFAEINSMSGSSDMNENFFKNVMSTAVPSEKISCPYKVGTQRSGKTARVQITPAQLHANATARIEIVTPDGQTISDGFTFDSSAYYYEFATPDVGKYSISVSYAYGGNEYSCKTGFDVSYMPEYDEFTVYEASVLYKMVGGDGTVSEDGNLKIENDESEVETYVIRLTVPFLAVCAVLFVADIIIRKLKWNDVVSLFGKVKKDKGGGK